MRCRMHRKAKTNLLKNLGRVMKLVVMRSLEVRGEIRVGSSPTLPTRIQMATEWFVVSLNYTLVLRVMRQVDSPDFSVVEGVQPSILIGGSVSSRDELHRLLVVTEQLLSYPHSVQKGNVCPMRIMGRSTR